MAAVNKVTSKKKHLYQRGTDDFFEHGFFNSSKLKFENKL
jgi:hypothetical protein